MASYNTILVEKENRRARITLNRPEKLNAISLEMHEEIYAALVDVENDKDVRAVILKGSGRTFSTGYDMTQNNAPDRPVQEDKKTFEEDTLAGESRQKLRMILFDMHKPVIAQVHGYCLAGAMDYAMMCDIVIAADDAKIGMPALRAVGTLPNHMWVYHCGPQWAKRLLLTGDMVSGADAATIGLILKAVPADLLEQEVEGLVDRITTIHSDGLAVNKRLVNLALELLGARTLQRLTLELGARGHISPANGEMNERTRRDGLQAALKWRDGPFGDGMASVQPEIRDADGRLVGAPAGTRT